jgi:hypothetical protein
MARECIAGKIARTIKENKPAAGKSLARKLFFVDTIEESSFRTRNGLQTNFRLINCPGCLRHRQPFSSRVLARRLPKQR